MRDLLGESGHNIIYFGDHLPADVMECSLHTRWRTCLIVPELQQNNEVISEHGFDEDFTKMTFVGQTDHLLQSSLFRFLSIAEVVLCMFSILGLAVI